MNPPNSRRIIGLLLASGRGTRFDPTGQQNKLLARLPGSDVVLTRSARNLSQAVDQVIVVIPPEAEPLRLALAQLPVEFVVNSRASNGMGNSIASGVAASPDAAGWIIALGDMPFIEVQTLRTLAQTLRNETVSIVAPYFGGKRGQPVGFSASHFEALVSLQGDFGARKLLEEFPVERISLDDAGILRDIDLPGDLEK